MGCHVGSYISFSRFPNENFTQICDFLAYKFLLKDKAKGK